jgi:hypothetical protein
MVWVFGVLGVGLMWLGLHPVTTYPLSLWLVRWWRSSPMRLLILFDPHEEFALWWSTPRRAAWRNSRRITGRLAVLGEIACAFPGGCRRSRRHCAWYPVFDSWSRFPNLAASAIRAPKSGWSVTAR